MKAINVHLIKGINTVTDGDCTEMGDIHVIGGAILSEGDKVIKSLTTAAVASIRLKKPVVMTPDISALLLEVLASR
ncbi:MAG: hypothetical protein WCP91_03395 [Candidatus Berkelbacteria bacterium]